MGAQVIEQTQLEKVWVSTVDITFTRLVDSILETVAPILVPEGLDNPGAQTRATEFHYETMVFPSDDGDGPSDWGELDCERYHDLDEARAGHLRMVEKWKEMDK